MRIHAGGSLVLIVLVALTLTGCQPGYRGQTGLTLGDDGLVYGTVHICRGEVAELSLYDGRELADWSFDESIDRVGTVALGTVAEVQQLLDRAAEGYFSAGTSGQVGVTTPLPAENVDLAGLSVGNVTYVVMGDSVNPYDTRVVDIDSFAELSCDDY